MSTLNALIKKREKLEKQIAEAQRLEKRKAEIVALLEKHNLLALTDAQILAALQPESAQSSPASTFTNFTTGSGA
ncbi:MAG: hypothetical protein AB7S53_06630 [Thiomonas sp.]